MARNVADLQLMLSVLTQGKSFAENPPVNINQYEYRAGDKLFIAYSETIENVELEEGYKAVYQDFVQKLKRLDFVGLVKSEPTYNSKKLLEIWGKVAGFDFGVALKKLPFKKAIASSFIKFKYLDKQWAKAMGKGAGISPREYAEALEQKDNVSDAFNEFFDLFDIWITPVSAIPAFKHQKTGKRIPINKSTLPYTQAFILFNFPLAVTGHPILVIPIGQTKAGLPVGVQIHAKRWHDYRLLQIGVELEKLTDGFQLPTMFSSSVKNQSHV
jgi:amidase